MTSLPNCVWTDYPALFHMAQVAEPVALNRAYTLSEDQPVTIYIDSHCAFGLLGSSKLSMGLELLKKTPFSYRTDLLHACSLPMPHMMIIIWLTQMPKNPLIVTSSTLTLCC